MKKIMTGLGLAAITALLVACGGGGSGGAATTATPTASAMVSGKFVDATTGGLGYKCGSATTLSGTTDANGVFTCPAGEAVQFSVGGIVIGSVNAAQAVVTPLDLVGVGASPANPQVIKIVRFLMSVSSSDPTTGKITIDPALATAAAAKSMDFAKGSDADLDALITSVKPGAKLYTGAEATAHLRSSVGGLFAGTYKGTFDGAMKGTFTLTISASGVITSGSYTDSDGDTGSVTGVVSTTIGTGGTYAYTGNADAAVWVGALNVQTGKLSGTWTLSGTGSGTFSN